MFGLDAPAKNVSEVIAFLKDNHKPQYVYRGQTKDYRSIIPSVFRRRGITVDHDFLIINEDGHNTFSKIEGLRHFIMNHFINTSGKIFGNYIAQQYYDGILINDTHELNPNIFTPRAALENIPTKELAFMAVALAGTDFRIPILEAIKKRQ